MSTFPTILKHAAPIALAVLAGFAGGVFRAGTCPCPRQDPQHVHDQLRTNSLLIVSADGLVVGEFSARSTTGSASLWLGDVAQKHGSSGLIRMHTDVVEGTPSASIQCSTGEIGEPDSGIIAISSVQGLASCTLAEHHGEMFRALDFGPSIGTTSAEPTAMRLRRNSTSWTWPQAD